MGVPDANVQFQSLHFLFGKKSPAALFSDIGLVSGGKKRVFCPGRVAACLDA
jgi:hypothetical protein